MTGKPATSWRGLAMAAGAVASAFVAGWQGTRLMTPASPASTSYADVLSRLDEMSGEVNGRIDRLDKSVQSVRERVDDIADRQDATNRRIDRLTERSAAARDNVRAVPDTYSLAMSGPWRF